MQLGPWLGNQNTDSMLVKRSYLDRIKVVVCGWGGMHEDDRVEKGSRRSNPGCDTAPETITSVTVGA
jgi:hypothetical protein